MIKTSLQNSFNLSFKQISRYRKYILNLVNRKWLRQGDDISTNKSKMRFTENKVHHFIPTDTIIRKVIKFDCYPKERNLNNLMRL